MANHPTLVDATFLLARLPDAICIFKPRLMRNPAIGPAALMGGYISGDAGIDLIRQAAEKVAGGNSLLIFPEGTRVPHGERPPLQAGFAGLYKLLGLPVVPAAKSNVPRRFQVPPPDFWSTMTVAVPVSCAISTGTVSARL